MSLVKATSFLWDIKKQTDAETVALVVRDKFFEIQIEDSSQKLQTTETLACVGSMFCPDLFIETIVESWKERKAMSESIVS